LPFIDLYLAIFNLISTCDSDSHLKTTTDTKLRTCENKTTLVLAVYA